jgi:hypothetical protein
LNILQRVSQALHLLRPNPLFPQLERESRVKEAIIKLERETRDRQNEEAQKAKEIEDLKREKKEREKAEREAMEEVKRLRKERADREKRERSQKEEIQKLKNDKGVRLFHPYFLVFVCVLFYFTFNLFVLSRMCT